MAQVTTSAEGEREELDTPARTPARWAGSVAVVFALNGATFATWAGRIPAAKSELGLSPGGLGGLLLFIALASLIALPLSGRITERFGVRRTVRAASVGAAIGVIVAGVGIDLLGSLPVTAAGLFVLGLSIGVWDVSMNLDGAAAERALGRSVMPRLHAAFSGGTVVAALLGTAAAAAGLGVFTHFAIVMPLVVIGVWVSSRQLSATVMHEPPVPAAASASRPAPHQTPQPARSAWREPRTLLIGLVTMVAAFTEGTANDWLSVAFVDGHDLPDWAGVLAFAVFLSAMTAGRLLGTRLLDQYGRVLVLRVTLAFAAAGSLIVIFTPSPYAYVGAVIWGAGVSLGFPVGMSAASDDPARAASRVSVVSTIAYSAFLAGPPLLGFLGDHVGVLHALLVVGGAVVVAFLAVPAVAPEGAANPEGAADSESAAAPEDRGNPDEEPAQVRRPGTE